MVVLPTGANRHVTRIRRRSRSGQEDFDRYRKMLRDTPSFIPLGWPALGWPAPEWRPRDGTPRDGPPRVAPGAIFYIPSIVRNPGGGGWNGAPGATRGGATRGGATR